MAETFGFGSFKAQSFYGGSCSTGKNLYSPHTPTSLSTSEFIHSKKSLSFSYPDSKKSNKKSNKTSSLFSGVKHGIKKPKSKKISIKKFVSAQVDKTLKLKKTPKAISNSESKENKPLNIVVKTPGKESKSTKKTNKEKDDLAFRYKVQTTPDHLKVKKVLPFEGFGSASLSTSNNKSGKKKLFSPDDDDPDCSISSKKFKSSAKKSKKVSPKKLFASENEKSITPKYKAEQNRNTPSLRSAKTLICETIELDETPSPKNATPRTKKHASLVQSFMEYVSPRKSPRLNSVAQLQKKSIFSSSKTSSPKKTPVKKSHVYDEEMIVDSPKTRNTPSLVGSQKLNNGPGCGDFPGINGSASKEPSIYGETPRLTRSSSKKLSFIQNSPKRFSSSKKNLFPKESEVATPVSFFEKDVTADSFNVFDILNDSLDGIELLDESLNGMTKEDLFNNCPDSPMHFSQEWENSPTSNSTNVSVCHTFPKNSDVDNSSTDVLNTFPRSSRVSRKSITSHNLSANCKSYSACKKTSKTSLDLSQLQLSSPTSNKCTVCQYSGDFEDEDHRQIHKTVMRLRHYAWKNEKVVETFENNERVICITSSDRMWLAKANSAIEVADSELGFAEGECAIKDNTKVYLYISKQIIVGLAVANRITQANRLISSSKNYSVDYASEEYYPATCGISRIWVLKTYRRNKIASKLLNAVRSTFTPESMILPQELAFSAPTSDGKLFAEKYTKRKDFLIFTEIA